MTIWSVTLQVHPRFLPWSLNIHHVVYFFALIESLKSSSPPHPGGGSTKGGIMMAQILHLSFVLVSLIFMWQLLFVVTTVTWIWKFLLAVSSFFFSVLSIQVFWFFEPGFFCSFGACSGTSSCRSGWHQTHRDLPVSASQVLGLKACATTAQLRRVKNF